MISLGKILRLEGYWSWVISLALEKVMASLLQFLYSLGPLFPAYPNVLLDSSKTSAEMYMMHIKCLTKFQKGTNGTTLFFLNQN